MTDAEIHTLAAPYALHALPDDEAELFEQHLANCAACRTEVDDIRQTAAKLGTATALVPSADLKARVMERIQEIRPLPPTGDHAEPSEPSEPSGARRRAIQRWWPRVATGLAAAMAVAVVALGIQLSETREELDDARAVGAQMRDLIAASDTEMVRVEADGSAGTAILARSLDMAVVAVSGMEPAPAEHEYQLWFIGDEGARSAGMLGNPDDGMLGPVAAHGVNDAEQMGITVEPEGGSDQPTSDPVMMMDLSA